MMLGGIYAFHALRRMHERFHAISPDELNLRPSLPFVQEMGGLASGAATVEVSKEIMESTIDIESRKEKKHVSTLF
jgi:hypothetical protein